SSSSSSDSGGSSNGGGSNGRGGSNGGGNGGSASGGGNKSGSQQRVVSACYATPSPGAGLCAMWVSQVFQNAGLGYPSGNACDMYNAWCTSASKSALKPGMIVAVSSHSSTPMGRIYGHVGIYVGGGMVMQNIGSVNTQSLDSWIAYYGDTVTPRWGWCMGIPLA
ncbi:MAG: NlpC/P60 family protein, partial [Olsenella profusa]